MTHLLATTGPSHGMQGFLFLVAAICFIIAVVIAWFTPHLQRAIAFGFAGFVFCAVVWAWVEFAVA